MTICHLCGRHDVEHGHALCSTCEPKASRLADVDSHANYGPKTRQRMTVGERVRSDVAWGPLKPKAKQPRCHKCGRFVGPDGYRDNLGESSLCAKLDHCGDVFFGE